STRTAHHQCPLQWEPSFEGVRILAANLPQDRALSRARVPERRPSQLAIHDPHKLRERNDKPLLQDPDARWLEQSGSSTFVIKERFRIPPIGESSCWSRRRHLD